MSLHLLNTKINFGKGTADPGVCYYISPVEYRPERDDPDSPGDTLSPENILIARELLPTAAIINFCPVDTQTGIALYDFALCRADAADHAILEEDPRILVLPQQAMGAALSADDLAEAQDWAVTVGLTWDGGIVTLRQLIRWVLTQQDSSLIPITTIQFGTDEV